MGPVGGAVIGGVFGLTSFLQCFGGSVLGTTLFGVNPVLTILLCFIPRILDGLLIGFISETMKKKAASAAIIGSVTGFFSAFFNTLFYMSLLILFFGSSEVIQNYREQIAPGKNILIFVCMFVGINAVAEMISSTLLTGGVSAALAKAKLVAVPKKAKD